MVELLGKSKEELRAFCAALSEPAYRGGQIYHALYAERNFDFVGMTNLPAALRERLPKQASVTLPELRQRFVSSDGSVRYLFGLRRGEEKGFDPQDREKESTEDTEKNRREKGETKRRDAEGTEKKSRTLKNGGCGTHPTLSAGPSQLRVN